MQMHAKGWSKVNEQGNKQAQKGSYKVSRSCSRTTETRQTGPEVQKCDVNWYWASELRDGSLPRAEIAGMGGERAPPAAGARAALGKRWEGWKRSCCQKCDRTAAMDGPNSAARRLLKLKTLEGAGQAGCKRQQRPKRGKPRARVGVVLKRTRNDVGRGAKAGHR